MYVERAEAFFLWERDDVSGFHARLREELKKEKVVGPSPKCPEPLGSALR
jgi:hypothetical protein